MIDISVPIHDAMPTWPSSIGVRVTQVMNRKAGDPANVSRLDCDVHTGTHVDAPRHFVDDGKGVDALPLDVLTGPCHVADARGVDAVTPEVLDGLSIPASTRRLLLRTDNSAWWEAGDSSFHEDYVALTADAAAWVVEHEIELVGVDYLSVQRFTDGPATHEILLSNDVVIVEALDLSGVGSGPYHLTCLPLRIVGADGAPARAMLQDPA
jgi:arylformamidase